MGLASTVIVYLVFGIVTSTIPNPFFTRMTPVGLLEQAYLLVTSIILGSYIGLLYYGKNYDKSKKCNVAATSGGIFGFLTFGCSVCNKILVFFLGVAGVLTYFEPIRPILGILSTGLLSFAIFTKAKNLSMI